MAQATLLLCSRLLVTDCSIVNSKVVAPDIEKSDVGYEVSRKD